MSFLLGILFIFLSSIFIHYGIEKVINSGYIETKSLLYRCIIMGIFIVITSIIITGIIFLFIKLI